MSKFVFDVRRVAVWITIFQLLTGCSGTSNSGAVANISDVEVGMTQSQVLAILGQPRMRETYGGTEFLIYPTDTGSIPIAIVDGRVTGIGRYAYDTIVQSMPRSDSTPSIPSR
jgi:hypothetical protein